MDLSSHILKLRNHKNFTKTTIKKRFAQKNGDIYTPFKTQIVAGYQPSHRAWMAFIQMKSKDDSRFKCGGSIINNYWILSAGHCFCQKLKCKASKGGKLKIAYKPSDHIGIITGLKDIDQINSKKPYQRSTPQHIIIHPL